MNKEDNTIAQIIHAKWLSPAVAGASLVISLYFSVKNQQLAERTKDLENKQTELKTEVLKKEFENNLKMEIFKEVKTTASTKASLNEQNLVITMVTDMLADFPIYRDNLLSILKSSSSIDTTIKLQTKKLQDDENKYESEQKSVELSNNSDKVKIDIFYLETGNSKSKTKAGSLKTEIDKNWPAKYQTRVRMLPRSVNAKSGYRLTANEMRYEKEETDFAKEVSNFINSKKILSASIPMQQIEYNTPNYISVFVADE